MKKHGIIQCLACDKVIESKFRHDFVECGCANQTFVDGGTAYLRYGAMDLSKIVILQSPDDDLPLVETEG